MDQVPPNHPADTPSFPPWPQDQQTSAPSQVGTSEAFDTTVVYDPLAVDHIQSSQHANVGSVGFQTINFDSSGPHDAFIEYDGVFDDILMGNFLYDIINAEPASSNIYPNNIDTMPDVLHVGFDELPAFPPPFAPAQFIAAAQDKDQNSSSLRQGGTEIPAVQKAARAGEQAFRESIWLWNPTMDDSSISEQINLALPTAPSIATHHSQRLEMGLTVSTSARDRLLSMILTTCEPRVQRQVVQCFPPVEFLSYLLSDFKFRHNRQISSWIHFPSLDINNESEEFLAALVCAGAADLRRPEFRKLGFALQEAARLAIMKKFEEDNRHLRDLRSMQALLLILNVGLNSASRRKIEIAESCTLMLVTMLRRGGFFGGTRYDDAQTGDKEQTEEVLELEWRKWAQEESFKRLVYHVLFQDVQTSAALFRQTTIAYSEVRLKMPCHPRLWEARSPEDWFREMLSQQAPPRLRPLQLQDFLQDPGCLGLHQNQVDVQMSLRALIAIFWSRAWQFIQMRAISSAGGGYSSLDTTSYLHQHLVTHSQDLLLRYSEGASSIHPCVKMMLELALMHLHVSLEDIQHLAGKEGQEQARRAAARLRSWITRPESRQALFHAGQVAKAAFICPLQYLRGFHAVMIYHASITMWAHTLLSTSQADVQPSPVRDTRAAETSSLTIQLDGEETPELRRYILLGQGKACIRRYCHDQNRQVAQQLEFVPLSDAAEIMANMAELLSSRDQSEYYCIPIVSYLTKLMHSLAKASAAMKVLREKDWAEA